MSASEWVTPPCFWQIVMVQRFKTLYAKLAEAEPGERFINYYRYRQRKGGEGRWKGVIGVTAGLCMVIMGSLLSIPPGVPGFLLSFAGLGLIAGRSRAVAVFLDRAECLM